MIIDLSPRALRAVKQALSQCATERRLTAGATHQAYAAELACAQAAEYEDALDELPEERDMGWMAERAQAALH